ncbi:MAG TPA: hypothetical protein HPP76_01110 [Desulfuromonadales bacterium]|nr:hypothetical protein [Desulfuromonadales bacterium]
MFPTHNPAQQVFNWHCRSNNIPEAKFTDAAVDMQEHVYRIRKLYNMPIGRTIPYNEIDFRSAYLLAYFPYYIEPICHVLEAAKLPDSLFASGTLKAAFFGGGPCPEALGLAAYLRKRARRLANVEATVFDRQPGWNMIHQELVPSMMPYYKSGNTTFKLNSRSCDVVECLARQCTCGVADKDIIIGQNFLAEVYTDRSKAIDTFERLIRRSTCRYLVFVENQYDEVKSLMNELSAHLYDNGLTVNRPVAQTTTIRPNFRLPQVMQQHLFVGSDGLRPKYNVHFHHMVFEIAR